MAGLYIHIPFCKTKCIYCDFYSVTSTETSERYISALADELSMRLNEVGARTINTIYIGGGTPSLLSISQLKSLIDAINEKTDLSHTEEFTIEVNPDDVTKQYITSLRELGVNRVSMGIQSFNDAELAFLNRRHTAQQAIKAVTDIRAGGISNVSIDLIYGIPGQTIASWNDSVNSAISLRIPHISCYSLSYEEGTRLYIMRNLGKIEECSEDNCIKMYSNLIRILKIAGYEHYEISNFAKPGMYSQHNSSYWNSTPYIGLGVSAHSFDGEIRRYNTYSLKDYLSKIENGLTAFQIEKESTWQRYNETVMIRLRTKWGLDSSEIKKIYGEPLYAHLCQNSEQFLKTGLLIRTGDKLFLTDKGAMLSDLIIRELMYVE